MKINKIKINSFGNINEKEIDLSEKINIIKGKNESGKSTILKFIINSFYGISRNKRGKEYSDYERYKPWGKEEFSGKLTYTLRDGEKYEIFRDFNKKNPQIYNKNSEEISKQYTIDKTNGSQFFYEQTKIDETMFTSTLISEQGEVKLDKQTQNFLIQKVANLAGTGDEKISYKKAIDKINKKQTDEIGTYRTQGKPINIIEEKIREIEKEIKEIEKNKEEQYEIENEKINIENEIKQEEKKQEIITEIKRIKEKEKLEKEKIKLSERIKEENESKIKQLKIQKIQMEQKEINNKQENIQIEKISREIKKIKNKQTKTNIIIIAIILVMIIVAIIGATIIKNKIITYISAIIAIVDIIELIIKNIIAIKKIKNKQKTQTKKDEQTIKIEEENKKEIQKIEAQIEVLEKSNEKQKREIEEMKSRMNLKINLEKEKIKNKKIEKQKIEYYINKENINKEAEEIQNKINQNKIQLHSLEIDKNNLMQSIEKLSALKEEKEELKEQRESLIKQNESIEIAKEVLEKAYQKMKENVTPKFTQNLSKNIEKITNGKYKNVRINDEEGIIVEKENGEYISVEKLSIGTIEQLYISLRFAMIEEITNEKMPIILDEAFAYYDSERLKNILKNINEQFKENQIIIFTCTEREKEILDKEKIEYKLIQI